MSRLSPTPSDLTRALHRTDRLATLDCRSCRHFDNGAAALEAAMPGLSSLSSAYAAVRADDGLCALHQRYVAASSVCGEHALT